MAHDALANLLLYTFPPNALIPQVIRQVREQEHKVLLMAQLWRNQHCFSELSQLLVAHSSEQGSPLSGKQDNLAPPVQAVGSAPLAYGWEPANLTRHNLNTISQAKRNLDAP